MVFLADVAIDRSLRRRPRKLFGDAVVALEAYGKRVWHFKRCATIFGYDRGAAEPTVTRGGRRRR
jgi:hypothetical protein